MVSIRSAQPGDLPDAIAALAAAFAVDPLMHYFFADNPGGVTAQVPRFFSILLQARLALAMPALVLEHNGRVMGLAMGYDTTRPTWPKDMDKALADLEAETPALAARFAAYEAIADAALPGEPHHYLGVIGLHPAMQGQGAGKALLDAFCALSETDPLSHGVFLETASPGNVHFYERNGFAIRGKGDLPGTPLWCLYQPNRADSRA
jgi:ribosomal protein S18 acetylase RimI-like enzyme